MVDHCKESADQRTARVERELRDEIERLRAIIAEGLLIGVQHLGDMAADQPDGVAAELARWKRECGPLLDYLTGSPKLCGSPVDYAKELQARLDAATAQADQPDAGPSAPAVDLRELIDLAYDHLLSAGYPADGPALSRLAPHCTADRADASPQTWKCRLCGWVTLPHLHNCANPSCKMPRAPQPSDAYCQKCHMLKRDKVGWHWCNCPADPM